MIRNPATRNCLPPQHARPFSRCRLNTRARIIHVKWVGSGDYYLRSSPNTWTAYGGTYPDTGIARGPSGTLLPSRGTRARWRLIENIKSHWNAPAYLTY